MYSKSLFLFPQHSQSVCLAISSAASLGNRSTNIFIPGKQVLGRIRASSASRHRRSNLEIKNHVFPWWPTGKAGTTLQSSNPFGILHRSLQLPSYFQSCKSRHTSNQSESSLVFPCTPDSS